ncbi:MAG: hypothetical protein RMK29_15695 [Myxococcales bacterium]|nr:ClpXP protease specificity-enhancing factor SspB [Myxococcota bacterium]MDW8283159.1 hypothetical protein [Myxococcales bacterium]
MVPDKREFLLHLLEDAWVLVHLDPRHPEVKLPEYLRQQPHLILQYGYNMPVPIVDLQIDDRGISATLSFQRTAHATFVPWAAVFAMADGDRRGYVWEKDVPKDLKPPAVPPPPQEPAKPARRPRPSYLKLVD